ncbi:MAG: hypothetical protein ACHWZW_02760 [Spirulina sp.]
MTRPVAASPEYCERLKSWVTAEAAKFADSPNDKGVNRWSAETYKILAQFGQRGISTTMVSRWINGDITDELRAPTLTKLGLLKGYSTDPEEAKRMAYLWLTTGQESKASPVKMLPVAIPDTSGSSEALDQILTLLYREPLSPQQMRQVIEAVLDRLVTLANAAPVIEPEPEPEPAPLAHEAISHLLNGWLKATGASLKELAEKLSITEERAKQILARSQLTPDECESLASLLNLNVETIKAWGVVLSVAPQV